VLVKKHFLPVYITPPTLHNGRMHLSSRIYSFRANETVPIGNLQVTPFSKRHDAIDPYSFVISCNGINAGVFTDIGSPCDQVIYHFNKCHAAFLEANYDEEMLEQGSYPYHLKRRIRSEKGHLSNDQALHLFLEHRSQKMSHLFLSHLSRNNNCPVKAGNLFNQHCGNTKIIVASRFQETAVYAIASPEAERTKVISRSAQMTLDFS
jgi:phosphoribosyl 1,2-cyclic phosphodiesterase